MFKELISILDDNYPFLNESESLITITYSILFWLIIGVSSCALVLLFPFLCSKIKLVNNLRFSLKYILGF